MKKLSTYLKWYFALTKRLLKKPSFLFTLLLIPLIAFSMNLVSKQDSGIITVAVAGKDKNDSIYTEILSELLSDNSSMLFYEAESPEDAKKALRNGKANSAWIFEDNLEERISRYVEKTKGNHLVEVYLVKDTVLYQLSREKLYSYLYKNLSYDVLVDFMDDQNFELESANEQTYRELFDKEKASLSNSIIEFVPYGAPEKKIQNLSYVTSPLKGLLAAALLICCLAAMMYSLQDEANGKYSMFAYNRRLAIHFIACLAAALFVSVTVFAARIILNDVYNIWIELVSSILYVIMVTGFCTLVGVVCKSPVRMCLVLPLIIVAVLAVCPIFVNTKGFMVIKLILPTYYYIQSTVDGRFLLYMLLYCFIIYPLCFILYRIFNKE